MTEIITLFSLFKPHTCRDGSRRNNIPGGSPIPSYSRAGSNEIIMEAGIEEISIGFSADKMDGEYGKSIEHYLPGLVHKLDVICKTGEEWQNMMRVTFNSLKNVCAEIAEKEQKNV